MTQFHTHLPQVKESFKGYVDVATRPGASGPQKYVIGELNWRERCLYYDEIFEKHGLAKSIATTIAGQFMAEGTFVQENDRIHDKNGQQAKEARDEIEQLNEDIGLDQLGYEFAVRAVKHGSVFLEQDITNWDLRIIPFQETIEPKLQDSQGEITDWRQIIQYNEVASWSVEANEIVPISWNVSGKSWPYGTSLYAGLDIDFETLAQLKIDIKEYMHMNAFPIEIYSIGDGQYMPTNDDLATIRGNLKVWTPGQKWVTSFPINHVAGGVGDRDVKGIDAVLPFVKEEIVDGGGIPPISKLWNATEASAKEMMPFVMANYISPLQRIFRRELEEHVYKPFLEELGYSTRLCPKLLFTPPDAHKVEEAQYWQAQIAGGLPAMYAWEEQGFDIEHILELQLQQQKQQLEQQKLQMALNPDVDVDAKSDGNVDSSGNSQGQEEKSVFNKKVGDTSDAKEFEEWTVRKRKAS